MGPEPSSKPSMAPPAWGSPDLSKEPPPQFLGRELARVMTKNTVPSIKVISLNVLSVPSHRLPQFLKNKVMDLISLWSVFLFPPSPPGPPRKQASLSGGGGGGGVCAI